MYDLYLVTESSNYKFTEIYLGSYNTLDILVYAAYYSFGDPSDPDTLFRLGPYDVYFRPYGVTPGAMINHLYDKIPYGGLYVY